MNFRREEIVASSMRLPHPQIAIFALCFLFICIWLVQNNAYRYDRDEIWYLNYSIAWDDSESNDIRYITESDIHQVAFLPTFRILLRAQEKIVPLNIYGYRLANLIIGTLALYYIFSFLLRANANAVAVLAFLSLFMLDPYLAKMSHRMRPDWIVACIMLVIPVLLHQAVERRSQGKIYVAAILSGLAAAVYWSGLGVSLAFVITMFWLSVVRLINKKTFFAGILVTVIVIFVSYFQPLVLQADAAKLLFSGSLVHQSVPLNNAYDFFAIANRDIRELFFGRGNHSLLLLGIICAVVFFSIAKFSSRFDIRKNKDEHFFLHPTFFYIAGIFLFVFSVVMVLRGNGARTYDILLPTLYLLFSVALAQVMVTLSKRWQKNILLIGCVAGSVMLSVHSLHFIRDQWGQWESYSQVRADFNRYIPDSPNGFVFTSYDMSLALPRRSFFFLESLAFSQNHEFSYFKETFSDVSIVVLDELNSERLEKATGGSPDVQYWHVHLKTILEEDFEIVGVVYNEHYRQKKGSPPLNKEGFRLQVFKRK